MWDDLTILWNDLTILWNDLTIDWNDLTWNDLTMERTDIMPHRHYKGTKLATQANHTLRSYQYKATRMGHTVIASSKLLTTQA